MYYADGSVYEGEWYNNMRNGEGMLRLGKKINNTCRKNCPVFFTVPPGS